eukprot:CAMPEP_0170280444 /NCGR_PEP_ID=MMETSP0116_2-20130129/40235_1 /TAXON_ID=400756 /ORGANISM="Durinskia baltica, Strain CSIRO CS-38" /LENGTH=361 /DNA_ID=CAMNT_0010531773 /DNA_START=111 /DNA_END=1196 /DNA_ORIENTATION=-
MADSYAQKPTSMAVGHPAHFPATIPKGLLPGERFAASRPDGEQVEVFVPEGAAPGDVVEVPWSVAPASPTPVVIGVPIDGVGGDMSDISERDLERGSMTTRAQKASEWGWTMYFVGWCFCCFCGPIGWIFWFCTWLTHYSRPKQARRDFPRERAVARLSCCTGLSAMVVHVVAAAVVYSIYRRGVKSCHELYTTPACMETPASGLWPGALIVFDCPRVCAQASCYSGAVFGGSDGEYAQGSAICGAALQAGVFADGVGGQVLVEVMDYQPVYFGTEGYGIRSQTVEGPLQGFIVFPFDDADGNISASNGTSIEPIRDPFPAEASDENIAVATTRPATAARTALAPTATTPASPASTSFSAH